MINVKEIRIDRVRTPTPRMVETGIHGSGDISLVLADGTVLAEIREVALCKSREGSWYLLFPHRKYEGKDESGKSVSKKSYFARIYPGRDDFSQEALQALITKFQESLSNAGPAKTMTKAQTNTVTEKDLF